MKRVRKSIDEKTLSERRRQLWLAIHASLVDEPAGIARCSFFHTITGNCSLQLNTLADFGFEKLDGLLDFYSDRIVSSSDGDRRISLIHEEDDDPFGCHLDSNRRDSLQHQNQAPLTNSQSDLSTGLLDRYQGPSRYSQSFPQTFLRNKSPNVQSPRFTLENRPNEMSRQSRAIWGNPGSSPQGPYQQRFPSPVTPTLTGNHWQQQMQFRQQRLTGLNSNQNQRYASPGFVFHPRNFSPAGNTSENFNSNYSLEKSDGATQNWNDITVDQVNEMARTCIVELAQIGEHVSVERIQQLLFQRLRINDIAELRLPRLGAIEHVEVIKDHAWLLCRVAAYIQTFCLTRSVVTLADLAQGLRDFASPQGDFSALNLGPLHKLPIIYELFKFPLHLRNYPNISTFEVFDMCRNYVADVTDKGGRKMNLENFMKFMVNQMDVPDAYHLGVRIRSFSLIDQTLKKCQYDAELSHRNALNRLRSKIQDDIEQAILNFRDSIVEAHPDIPNSFKVRLHYMDMTSEEVIEDVFEKYFQLKTIDVRRSRKEQQVLSSMRNFLNILRVKQTPASLFRLAVCVSNDDLEALMSHLNGSNGYDDEEGGSYDDADYVPDAEDSLVGQDNEQPSTTEPLPNAEAVASKVCEYLEHCLTQNSSLSLSSLQKVEAKVLDHYKCDSFFHLDLGSFLKFALSHKSIRKILDENCGIVLGSGQESGVMVDRGDVLQLMRQATKAGLTQTDELERVLCSHFNVSRVTSLGYGGMERLTKAASADGTHKAGVAFEAALCLPPRSVTGHSGLLGDQTRDSALVSIHNCPLLGDLHDWTNWGLVFEPCLGSLKDFLHRYNGLQTLDENQVVADIFALEVTPNVFLKLVSETSIALFTRALISGDVTDTCGHLVSLIVKSMGVMHAPVALLANHVKSALATMSDTSTESATSADRDGTTNRAVNFVLQCLVTLPRRFAVFLATEVFLDPLGQHLGMSRSKTLLLQAATAVSTAHAATAHSAAPHSAAPHLALDRLHYLGLMLSIPQWMDDILHRSTVITTCTENHPTPPLLKNPMTADDKSREMSVMDWDEENARPTGLGHSGHVQTVAFPDADVMGDNSLDANGETIEDEADGDTSNVDRSRSNNSRDFSSFEAFDLDSRRAYVDRIRRERFGVGVELSSEGERLLREQQEMLGRGLDRLSHDLYSKDTHFVLELIQNADDNEYPAATGVSHDGGECPSMKFVVKADRVCIYNNERGFREEHIGAICDVGHSTKGKHKYGYIGQKGIGFKSVFRVTDRPEIHSNGFHINFDINSGPMGYILPHWIDSDDASHEADDALSWTTRIVLPFKGPDQYRILAARFSEIHPSLLLFVRRLRRITIRNEIEPGFVTMKRRDIDKNVVEIRNADSTETWFVVKRSLDVSAAMTNRDADIESTEVALAFLVSPLLQRPRETAVPMARQPVFAYLPLRSYGFRFIVQGDFDVPASREDVKADSAWNLWIRQEIPSLFIEALDAFRCHAMFDDLQAVRAFFKFVPFEDEIVGFFKTVASDILQKLRASPCMPTEPDANGEVLWRKPGEVVTTTDPLVYEVLNADLLMTHLNLYYVHRNVASVLSHSLITSLGIETVGVRHLLRMGHAISLHIGADDGVADAAANKMATISKWLACVYRSKDDLHASSDDVLREVRSLRIYPLVSAQFVSLDSHTVFFPTKATHNSESCLKQLGDLEADLNTVDSRIFENDDEVVNSQVRKFLGELGVKAPTAGDVVTHHVMPMLESQQWQNKSRELWVSYLVYLREISDTQPHLVDMATLRQCAPVVTNHGIVNASRHSVHFSRLYGNTVDLTQCLPGYDWTILDSCYMAGNCGTREVKQWRDFFTMLGVGDYPAVKEEKITLSLEDLKTSPWAAVKDSWSQATQSDVFVIDDYICRELEALLTNNTQPDSFGDQMAHLCMLLDRQWDARYKQYISTHVSSPDGEVLSDVESSFALLLKTASWLPAFTFTFTTNTTPVIVARTPKMCRSSLIYAADKNIEALLGCTVDYLTVEMSVQSSFTLFLQIKTSVSVEEVVDMLKESGARRNDGKPREFVMSLNQANSAYKYIFDNLSRKRTQDLFREFSVIFAPLACEDRSAYVRGEMVNRDQAWWGDPTGLVAKYRLSLRDSSLDIGRKVILEEVYAELREFFCSSLVQVRQTPTVRVYAELLKHLSETQSLHNSVVFGDVLRLLDHLGAQLRDIRIADDVRNVTRSVDNNDIEEMKVADDASGPTCENLRHYKEMLELMQQARVYPVKPKKWVRLDENPMIADDRRLENLFRDQALFHVIDFGDKSHSGDNRSTTYAARMTRTDSVREFLIRCGVRLLSDCVETWTSPGLTKPCPEAQLYLCRTAPYIQLFLLTKYREVYQQHKRSNMAAKIKTIIYYQVSKLEVVYSLKHSPTVTVVRNEPCLFTDTTFYVQYDHLQSYNEVNRHLAVYFSLGEPDCARELRFFLTDLEPLVKSQAELCDVSSAIANTLEHYDVDERLPVGEELWEVPEPAVIALPPAAVRPSEMATLVAAATPPTSTSARRPPSDPTTLRSWPPNSGQPSLGPPAPGSQNEVKSADSLSSARKRNTPDTLDPSECKRLFLNTEAPVWDRETPVISYEELGSASSLESLPSMPVAISDDPACIHDIGLWGEELVHNYLTELQRRGDIREVVWSRQAGAITAPFDFMVTTPEPNTGTTHITYIEVKTTISDSKEIFAISPQELRFAFQNKDQYQVFRIYGACSRSNLRLVRIQNVVDYMDRQAVKLFMQI